MVLPVEAAPDPPHNPPIDPDPFDVIIDGEKEEAENGFFHTSATASPPGLSSSSLSSCNARRRKRLCGDLASEVDSASTPGFEPVSASGSALWFVSTLSAASASLSPLNELGSRKVVDIPTAIGKIGMWYL